jgi:hypothetical protein
MSKQKGLVRLDGKMGGISFYRLAGEDLARLAGGPTKERILNDPAFVRTRENNSEFGGSATAAKALRIALATGIQSMADFRISSRLTKLFKDINTKGDGTRGQRGVTVSANRSMLLNLEFNERTHFASVFNAPFTYTNNAERTLATVTVQDFLPATYIAAPPGATHFRLIHIIGVVSDYVYNVTTGGYEPSDPTLNTLNAVAYSAITPLNSSRPVNFTLDALLTGTLTMTTTVSVVECLGIEFYQRIGTVDYILAQNNAMKVINVF